MNIVDELGTPGIPARGEGRPIGLVSTWFPEKRATPRQPGICASSQGKLTLYNSVFTNPEHALEGLECFSHMWILFYFHKNDSTHVRAKVSPPRLNGARTGVFGTRSPHRPSPIGLSLVSIDKIDGATVYFSGVDMVDGTPVIDIKPFIPQYDNPVHYESPDSTTVPSSRLMDGREAENETPASASAGHTDSVGTVLSLGNSMDRSSLRVESRIGEREAPDGEEEISSPSTATASISVQSERTSVSPSTQVRVPSWITQPPVSKLSVTFTDRAKAQLEEISCISGTVESPLVSIKNVLQEDPRSVYLRERWGNQFYTFLICNLHVSCKFNDCDHTVAVFQVKSAGKLCECGWTSRKRESEGEDTLRSTSFEEATTGPQQDALSIQNKQL
uniref:TsaA-like domain-containing protein n=1 Tax=Timema tahoe TaxID=61484 RepID=A0A7R9FFP1_9NEOP|nr:unnamed protein product [Timema tahoe]